MIMSFNITLIIEKFWFPLSINFVDNLHDIKDLKFNLLVSLVIKKCCEIYTMRKRPELLILIIVSLLNIGIRSHHNVLSILIQVRNLWKVFGMIKKVMESRTERVHIKRCLTTIKRKLLENCRKIIISSWLVWREKHGFKFIKKKKSDKQLNIWEKFFCIQLWKWFTNNENYNF